MNANEKVAKQIADNMLNLFAGYYFEKPASEVPKPDAAMVAKIILPELASAGRPHYSRIGTTIYEDGSTLVVFNAPTEKLAEEILTAFNTYG